MKKLLQTLTETFGPSGYEDKVREIVLNEVKSLADEIRVDALGNLIVAETPGQNCERYKEDHDRGAHGRDWRDRQPCG